MSPTQKTGFTLIELMMATVILIMIVMIMSSVFHQSSVAWDSGMRKAEDNMNARAVLGFMARELADAVAIETNDLTGNISDDVGQVIFVTLGGTNNVTTRLARRIRYQIMAGTFDYSVERTVWDRYPWGGTPYGDDWQQVGDPLTLITNVTDLKFYTSGHTEPHVTDLPQWVRIEMGLRKQADVSSVGAWSLGPDENDDEDDIESW